MTDPTKPQDIEFRPVSPKLIAVRVGVSALCLVVLAIAAAVVGAVTSFSWLYLASGAILLLLFWLLWLIPRQVRAMGYATAEQDFLVRKGVMFRSLVVVPYGRIQYVDVHEGPVARMCGIATIQLHTASAHTDASLDGLPAAAAAELRDLLVANGSSELSGL